MLPPDFTPLVAERFKGLQGPVKLDYFHQSDSKIVVPGRQPCPSCPPTLEVLQEIAALHDDVALRVHDFHGDREAVAKWGAERVPGIVIHGEVNRPIRFYGMPGGMLLWALIDAIVGASGKPASVPTELTALLKKLRAQRACAGAGLVPAPRVGARAPRRRSRSRCSRTRSTPPCTRWRTARTSRCSSS